MSRIPCGEVFERMNFLYQAAVEVYSKSPSLSRFYISQMIGVAEKLVLRM
jgi:RNase P subunit RPR2